MSKSEKKNPIPQGTAKLTVLTFAVMNIVAVVSLRYLPSESVYGLSSVFFFAFAAIAFLIPISLVAAELATGWPEPGGIFRWIGESFGGKWGFCVMFLMLVQVCVFFPTALTFGSVSLAFISPNQAFDQTLSNNKLFVLSTVLIIYWVSTFVAFHGVETFSKIAKWGGIIGTIIPAIILVVLGFAYYFSGQPIYVDMSWSKLVPDFTNFHNIVLAVGIFLAYAGIEMNAIHVKELDNPTRSYPLAIVIASIGVVAIFVLGTLAVAFVIPKDQISLTQSVLVAFFNIFHWAGLDFLAPITAVCLTIGVLANVVTWVAGPSSGLLAVAKAGYLPRFFQHTNKHGMATHILLLQGIIATILSTLFVVLPSVEAAYQILSQLAAIIYLTIYMFVFSAAIHLRFSQPNRPRPYKIPFGNTGMYIFAGLGFVGVAFGYIFSFIPPGQIAVGSSTEYISILVGLTVIFYAIPLLIYSRRKPHWRDPNSDFAPFTWEIENTHPGVPNLSDKHTPHCTSLHHQNRKAKTV